MDRQRVPVVRASMVQAKALERGEHGTDQQGVFLIRPQRCSQFFLIRARQIEQAGRFLLFLMCLAKSISSASRLDTASFFAMGATVLTASGRGGAEQASRR